MEWLDWYSTKTATSSFANHSFWSYNCENKKQTTNHQWISNQSPPKTKKLNNLLSRTPPNKQKKQSIQPNQASKITNQTPNNNHPVFRWEMRNAAHVSKASRETCAMCHSLGALDFFVITKGCQITLCHLFCGDFMMFFLMVACSEGIFIYNRSGKIVEGLVAYLPLFTGLLNTFLVVQPNWCAILSWCDFCWWTIFSFQVASFARCSPENHQHFEKAKISRFLRLMVRFFKKNILFGRRNVSSNQLGVASRRWSFSYKLVKDFIRIHAMFDFYFFSMGPFNLMPIQIVLWLYHFNLAAETNNE